MRLRQNWKRQNNLLREYRLFKLLTTLTRCRYCGRPIWAEESIRTGVGGWCRTGRAA